MNVVKSISIYKNQEEMSNMNTNKLLKIGLSALISTSMLAGCTKKFAVPLVKRRIKSYIIFIVYLTECTSVFGEVFLSVEFISPV